MGLKKGTVVLEEYNENWDNLFEHEKNNLEKIFGKIAIEIEHIGSTAIKGLMAKPIIDIAVAVKKLEDFNLVKEYFANLPYEIKENPTQGEELIIKTNNDYTTHLIHVMEKDSNRYKNTIIFRDYLRNNKNVVSEYQQLKYELAIKYANDRKSYTSSKNKFIQNILNNAYKELELEKENVLWN